MDISTLPFNQLIALETAADESGYETSLPAHEKYTNHLGTVHASALLAVAEAGSGAFIAKKLSQLSGFVPVVRRIEAKFRKPAHGQVSSKCIVSSETITTWITELSNRGRLSISIPVEVVSDEGTTVMSATVEWFISKTT